ncbi:T6SS immunity protein Tli4 family protein [Paraburkholderia caffeinilytica]|uniref:T6SS immunity protein Tli4 family protein n=1 Tax=Paraburkholderia caffeinilytica TaxID=1761016 RepID=UPI003DA0DE15
MLKRIAKTLLLVAGLDACSAAFSGEPTMTSPLLSKTRPWCIGRFVFDRPAASEISNQRYEFRGEKLETQYNVPVATYQAKVEAREKELRTRKRIDPGNRNRETSHFWLEKALSPIKDSRVFVYQDSATEGVSLPFDSEGFIYENGMVFHTVGGFGSTGLNKVDDFYNNLYHRIKARDNWSVPVESGFCFDGGIVTGSSTYPEEVSQSFALMPEHRPALLLIQMRDSVSQDRDPAASLLKTLPDLRAKLDAIDAPYRILRQGHRKIAGMDAEEVLFEVRDGGVTEYRFSLLAPGDPSTLAKPHTSIQMILGDVSGRDMPAEERTAPVDEAGALQAWDTFLNSLRLRPGAV